MSLKSNWSTSTQKASSKAARGPDDFESVARQLGADEDKARFEVKPRKTAKSKPKPK